MKRIELHIERVVVDGLDRPDSARLAAHLEDAIRTLVLRSDVAALVAAAHGHADVRRSVCDLPARGGAAWPVIAATLARSVLP